MGGAFGAACCPRFKPAASDMETSCQALFLCLHAPANVGAFVLAVMRVCLGVHCPLDRVGSAGVALLSATVSMHCVIVTGPRSSPPPYRCIARALPLGTARLAAQLTSSPEHTRLAAGLLNRFTSDQGVVVVLAQSGLRGTHRHGLSVDIGGLPIAPVAVHWLTQRGMAQNQELTHAGAVGRR